MVPGDPVVASVVFGVMTRPMQPEPELVPPAYHTSLSLSCAVSYTSNPFPDQPQLLVILVFGWPRCLFLSPSFWETIGLKVEELPSSLGQGLQHQFPDTERYPKV